MGCGKVYNSSGIEKKFMVRKKLYWNLFSTQWKSKSNLAERFFRTLKIKIYKYMTSI